MTNGIIIYIINAPIVPAHKSATRRRGKYLDYGKSVIRISPGGKSMNKYEMIYILDAALSDEDRDALISKFEGVVTKNGGSVEKIDKWGVKKLAYPIDYKTEGYYVYMAFSGDSNLVQEVKRVVGITERVLRRLITRV
mgnify:CR=1 FL=1